MHGVDVHLVNRDKAERAKPVALKQSVEQLDIDSEVLRRVEEDHRLGSV